MPAMVWLLVVAPAVRPVIAAQKHYAAKRFDVALDVRPEGDLEVAEAITFDFVQGAFTKVWREIPARGTDGIAIVEATMDGKPFMRGIGPGHFAVTGSTRVRVEWQFAPVEKSTHTFGLTYVARGVAFRDGNYDTLAWRALPAEHTYTIARSRILLRAGESPVEDPQVTPHRVASIATSRGDGVYDIGAAGIRSNGWILVTLRFPAGRILSTPPEWQQRANRAAALAPRWAGAAAITGAIGILLMLAMRQSYRRPALPSETTAVTPPEDLPPALSAALLSNGRTSVMHAMATLFDLADRGILGVREAPRHLGVRRFEFVQNPATLSLEAHEEAALRIAFADSGEDVTVGRARARLSRGIHRFASTVEGELDVRGLLDRTRKAVYDRLRGGGVLLLIAGAVAVIPAATVINRYGPYPLLLPLALAIAGMAGIAMSTTVTSLSDEGVMHGAQWRGFRRRLRSIAADRQSVSTEPLPGRYVAYAIAAGLAPLWSRYLKRNPSAVPAWFAAMAADAHDSGIAFAAFVGGAGASGPGSGGGAGGAGGGASGAG